MKLSIAMAARIAVAAVACAAAAVPVMALASSGKPGAARVQHGAVPSCTSSEITTWLGLGSGGGTLGTALYPIEFSNTGKAPCSLSGYPNVFAVSGRDVQLGLPGVGRGQRPLVVLRPGGTAHVVLGVIGADKLSGCELRPGAFLEVIAPGQANATFIPSFTFTACANKGVLVVDGVHAGTGIPGNTAS